MGENLHKIIANSSMSPAASTDDSHVGVYLGQVLYPIAGLFEPVDSMK